MSSYFFWNSKKYRPCRNIHTVIVCSLRFICFMKTLIIPKQSFFLDIHVTDSTKNRWEANYQFISLEWILLVGSNWKGWWMLSIENQALKSSCTFDSSLSFGFFWWQKSWSKFQPLGKIPGFLSLHKKSGIKTAAAFFKQPGYLFSFDSFNSPFPFAFLSILLHFLDLFYFGFYHFLLFHLFIQNLEVFFFSFVFSWMFSVAFSLTLFWLIYLADECLCCIFSQIFFSFQTSCKRYQTKM